MQMVPSNNFAKPNGFSLPELLIAAGLSFLVVLSSAILIENLLGQDRAIKGALTADTQLDQADYIIQRYFRSAVDIKYVTGAISNTQSLSSGTEGEIVQSFDSDPSSGVPPVADQAISTLALFYRDTAVINAATGVSNLKPTGMYFQQPGPDTYGVLYIDDGSNGTSLKPALGNLVVDHVTRLQIDNVTTTVMPMSGATPLYVRSFELVVTIRLPTYTNSGGKMNWCGPNRSLHDATCRTGEIPYKDTTRAITVIIYDNYDPNAIPADGPSLGRVYFAR